ncbi:UDP-N-acetylmuramoylalanine--D-glutamate ligase [Desulfacinum hydrothermale DSM 13146]|uniref:UDP-N-acetylmuramoylalanine--D-glutamate ligase n=1 Tax=Desulfacinum hydrothermale DSM 13146 TaxID=1121390 RepID=A0A1W1XAK5_9BACT|nr:UDP-N-acetylmuramoyl-L-alanine--D-glutamate ligase [Desulfacinum hydrothermale]SMC20952.1 UDP-N-acetylmuramoylalanine--D-glutamate ligase [Desulfacinum hydrothermale DSM 13146]
MNAIAAGVGEERRNLLVVGLGVSGRAACRWGLRQGFRVHGTDASADPALRTALAPLERQGATFSLGGHGPEAFLNADLIVVSPGVPLSLPALEAARTKGAEIIGELEWAWRFCRVPTVAVTGTNGKTTTTELIGAFLKEGGKRAFVGGNLGTPLCDWLAETEGSSSQTALDWCVLEVSSFQLDAAPTFAPRIGAVLNVTPDHLDRYPDLDAYTASKFSMFRKGSGERQTAVLNGDDPVCRKWAEKLDAQVLFFSSSLQEAAARVIERRLHLRLPNGLERSFDLDRWALKGVHNLENLMAASLVAALCGVAPEAMQRTIDSFRPSAHRMEWIATVEGVHFINDSKGTNVGAVSKALESCDTPVVLLMGGRAKGTDFRSLGPLCREKVRCLVAFGEAGPAVAEDLSPFVDTTMAANLDQAFQMALERARPGDTVLLSPGCASFDQYANYAERGEHFRRLVRAWKEKG